MVEATFWKWMQVYKQIDTIICCSQFMKTKMDTNPIFAEKTVKLHNFIDEVQWQAPQKKGYILYFGRYSQEKGVDTLLQVCKNLPHIPFVFAGSGPLEDRICLPNVKNVGFQTGDSLKELIRQARFSVYPSEWYENCPFSVMESQQYGTPVLGADIGGIPELIQVGKTGDLFQSGSASSLQEKILALWENCDLTDAYTENCKNLQFDTVETYCQKLMAYYQ
jgi:glycosyltransferase involved in cell wall biosynthesis